MPAKRRCPDCGGPVAVGEFHCGQCGKIREETKVECESHPGVPARHLCVVCGKPLCDGCDFRLEGISVCRESDHPSVLLEWEILRSVRSSLAADLLVRNLSLNGIPVRAFDRSVFGYGGLIPGCDRTTVWTRRRDAQAAASLVVEMEIDDLEEEAPRPAARRGRSTPRRPRKTRRSAKRSSR